MMPLLVLKNSQSNGGRFAAETKYSAKITSVAPARITQPLIPEKLSALINGLSDWEGWSGADD
jgi:hypothetical protein